MGKNRAIFITATDTNAGKTIATFVLGTLLQSKGMDVGVMKPVQCAGKDAAFLKKSLKLSDDLALINPCYAPEPLSPHLAFARAGTKVDLANIRRAFNCLRKKHEVLLIEGAGGLMVPLTQRYYTADLVRDLNAELIIVSRLGLGTINHTLLTVNQAKAYGIRVKGILFSDMDPKRKSVPEQTNPVEIGRLSGCPVLGIIPFLKTKTQKAVLSKCLPIAAAFSV